MKWILLAMLMSNVYASEELRSCCDVCLDAFRHETNTYPNMPNEWLMMLSDIAKKCCRDCERAESARFSFVNYIKECHRECSDVFNAKMTKAKPSERMDIGEEARGCHMRCDFIQDLKRGFSK